MHYEIDMHALHRLHTLHCQHFRALQVLQRPERRDAFPAPCPHNACLSFRVSVAHDEGSASKIASNISKTAPGTTPHGFARTQAISQRSDDVFHHTCSNRGFAIVKGID